MDEHDEKWYRQYLGGTGIGVYYAMTEIPAGADPLGPDNVLTLSASVIVGAPLPALSRVSCNMKSPLTGGIGDAQGGGYWAPELKYAGFDAVVLKGRSETPVYLWIHDGQCEIRDASHLWGKDMGESEAMVREELGDNLIRVAGLGPAVRLRHQRAEAQRGPYRCRRGHGQQECKASGLPRKEHRDRL